ncbi:hypothetical protein FPV67DRAFT_1458374 [Lyophyllum atratum]|nr:hypothetical protein FPV67DRAFT_1458374 [Lyophyllum atratum]
MVSNYQLGCTVRAGTLDNYVAKSNCYAWASRMFGKIPETEYQAPDRNIDMTVAQHEHMTDDMSVIDIHSSVAWDASKSLATLPQAFRDAIKGNTILEDLLQRYAEADLNVKTQTNMYFDEALKHAEPSEEGNAAIDEASDVFEQLIHWFNDLHLKLRNGQVHLNNITSAHPLVPLTLENGGVKARQAVVEYFLWRLKVGDCQAVNHYHFDECLTEALIQMFTERGQGKTHWDNRMMSVRGTSGMLKHIVAHGKRDNKFDLTKQLRCRFPECDVEEGPAEDAEVETGEGSAGGDTKPGHDHSNDTTLERSLNPGDKTLFYHDDIMRIRQLLGNDEYGTVCLVEDCRRAEVRRRNLKEIEKEYRTHEGR